ncbi:11666_t:CDS:2 [Funneliformis mosseae]|uniref:11666_t:CDS:1 n=1 Tax=Funneliformis mosseae TaxID=27381 RepID=A0A9N9FFW0_FUNMO|nr:11666_t:CDS:2 [Funneliformis mosseae]
MSLSIIDDRFYSILNIDTDEIGLELMLGFCVSIDSLDERNIGVPHLTL